eukprot:758750-Hanusia_phi.AAC.3
MNCDLFSAATCLLAFSRESPAHEISRQAHRCFVTSSAEFFHLGPDVQKQRCPLVKAIHLSDRIINGLIVRPEISPLHVSNSEIPWLSMSYGRHSGSLYASTSGTSTSRIFLFNLNAN